MGERRVYDTILKNPYRVQHRRGEHHTVVPNLQTGVRCMQTSEIDQVSPHLHVDRSSQIGCIEAPSRRLSQEQLYYCSEMRRPLDIIQWKGGEGTFGDVERP